jgi:hypothetical protein
MTTAPSPSSSSALSPSSLPNRVIWVKDEEANKWILVGVPDVNDDDHHDEQEMEEDGARINLQRAARNSMAGGGGCYDVSMLCSLLFLMN